MSKLVLSEKEIIALYVDEKMSMFNIGKKYNCSTTPIIKILKENNIRIRKRGETFRGVPKTYPPWNKGLKGVQPPPWNKGLTKATSKRLQLVAKKVSITLKGNIPWNKGMVFNPNKGIRDAIRDKQVFKNWRYKVYKRDKNTCQLCGHKSTNKLPVNAHHIYRLQDIIIDYNITTIEEAYECDMLWNINNGITLCQSCHKAVHREGVMPK